MPPVKKSRKKLEKRKRNSYNQMVQVVTSIKPQKNGKRVNIYLDEEFGFGLDLENFVKLGLRVGQKFSEEEVEKIVKKAEFQKTYDKILRFAALRLRSEKEFRDWLRKHDVQESLHYELFNRLKRLDFLNDKKFSEWWVEQRQAFRPKSKRILHQELRIKGVKKEIIEEVLSKVKIDEVWMAKRLLEKKGYKWEGLNKLESNRKRIEFLLRKGFSWEVVKKALGTSID